MNDFDIRRPLEMTSEEVQILGWLNKVLLRSPGRDASEQCRAHGIVYLGAKKRRFTTQHLIEGKRHIIRATMRHDTRVFSHASVIRSTVEP